jgi:hypothetical protein
MYFSVQKSLDVPENAARQLRAMLAEALNAIGEAPDD